MSLPYHYEMDRRPSTTRSITEQSTLSDSALPTEKVQIQVGDRASGELADVEKTLKRGLEARQISMMALGGAIGTGLIIGSSTALVRGGPAGLLIGYVILGVDCWCVMMSLGEMAAYLPHKKGFAGYVTRFWHPAGGFALGWNYLFNYWFLCPIQINSATLVLSWWTKAVPSAVWIALIIIGITGVNLGGIRFLGEVEFWFSSVKVIALIGLILFGIFVDAGVNPKHQVIGFTNYRPPNGPFGSYLEGRVGMGDTSKFLGVCSVLSNALFAYLGTELVGVTVGEATNPRKTIPAAIKRTFWRILIFYIGNVFVIGLIVPRTEPLFTVNTDPAVQKSVAVSPFVAAARLLAIRGLDHVLNAIALIFVISAANTDLYISSRTLYGLALEGKAPVVFKRVNRLGVPYTALGASIVMACCAFMNVRKGPGKVLEILCNLSSTFGALAWVCITYTHIRFMGALKLKGIDRQDLPWRAPFQPGAAWFALILTGIIILFKGFDAFMPFKADTFITAYIALPLFALFFIGWRYYDGCRTVPLDRVDLVSGKKQIDEEEEEYLAAQDQKGPKSRLRRFWDAL